MRDCARVMVLVPVLALMMTVAAEAPAGAAPQRVVVMGMVPRGGADPALAELAYELFVVGMRRQPGLEVRTRAEAAAVLALEQEKQAAGLDGADMLRAAAALDASLLVDGAVDRVGDAHFFTLSLQRVPEGTLVRRVERRVDAAGQLKLEELMTSVARDLVQGVQVNVPPPAVRAEPRRRTGSPVGPVLAVAGLVGVGVGAVLAGAGTVAVGMFAAAFVYNQRSLNETGRHALAWNVQVALQGVLVIGGAAVLLAMVLVAAGVGAVGVGWWLR